MKLRYILLLSVIGTWVSAAKSQSGASIVTELSENNSAFVFTSPDGKYAGGYSNGFCHLYSEESDHTQYFGTEVETYVMNNANNDGVVVGAVSGYDITMSTPAYYKQGEWHMLPLSAGAMSGSISGISDDGTKMVGWCQKGWSNVPCIWVNGKVKTLKYPAMDFYGMESIGAVADNISGDGSLISGRYYLSNGRTVFAIWKDTDSECEFPFIELSYDFDNTPTMQFPQMSDYITVEWGDPLYEEQFEQYMEAFNNYLAQLELFEKDEMLDARATYMSHDGRYFATVVYSMGMQTNTPARIDMSDMSMIRLNDFSDAIALSVNNHGDMIIADPLLSYNREPYLYKSDENSIYKLNEWILENHGLDIMNDEQGINSLNPGVGVAGSPIMSADGSRIYGYTYDEYLQANNYRIRLDQSMALDKTVDSSSPFEYFNNTLAINNSISKIEIFDLMGNTVQSYKNKSANIDLNHLAPGVYIVRSLSQSKVHTQKIRIQ